MKRKIKILIVYFLFQNLFANHVMQAQVISAPVIDTALTTSKIYFYNGEIVVPYSNGNVSILNNAEIEILSTTEVTLLPGFTASVDDGCGKFVGGIYPCPSIVINSAVHNISCYGQPNGRIRLLCSGGIEPYSFNWMAINKITQSLSGLSSGVYSVIVTDQAGCTATDSITILEPAPISAVVSTTNSVCHESSGTATVTPSGGVGGYTYFWEKDGYGQASRNELSAGLYEILITDSNNCQANVNALISDSDGPEVSVEILSGVSCHGFNNASALITLPSSTGPEPVLPCGSPADRLGAGHHPVIQADSNGCITIVDVNIVEPDPLEIVISTVQPECGNNDGILSAQVSGGTEPYSFSWSNEMTDSLIDNLYSGIYSLTIVDANGCNSSKVIFLPDSNSFDLSITKVDVKCHKSSDGMISVSPVGGVAPYTYTWFDEISEIGYNNAQIESLPTGLYSIFVIDNHNCKSLSTISILYPEEFDLQFQTVIPSNDSSSDGSITAYLNGGVPPYEFEWSNSENLSSISNLSAGTYSYRISDQNDCILKGEIDLHSFYDIQIAGCSPNPTQQPYFVDIMAFCSIPGNCTPLLPGLTELNIITHFGARPNDGLSDQQSFEWASEYIRLNYCSLGPVKLIIPPGTYIVGRQDLKPNTYLLGYNPLWFCFCPNVTIEGQIDPLTGEKPKIVFDNCLKYGSFDPATGNRLFRNLTIPMGSLNGDLRYAADVGYMLYAVNCENFSVRNIDFDGNINNLSIGGYFASDLAGINRPNGGIRFDGCSKVVIDNCTANNFGQDGLLIRDDGSGLSPNNMDIRILHSQFNHNSRAGFHWNGGANVFARGCVFNYNGFGPWGGTKNRGGLEMEIDELYFADLANGSFLNCDFMFNNSASIISNGQYAGQYLWDHKFYNFLFKGCRIASASRGYATYINNRDVTFKCCDFAGMVFEAYDATNSNPALNRNTKFISCSFNEEFTDPISSAMKAFTWNQGNCFTGDIGELNSLINIEKPSGSGRVLFDNCKINAARYCSWALLNGGPGLDPVYGVTNKITIRNTDFYKVRGDEREPTIVPNQGQFWNKFLINFTRVIVTQNNHTYIPHSDPSLCFCDVSTGNFMMYPGCWQGYACLASGGVVSTLKLPVGDSNVGYCDRIPLCGKFYPDGYTDASYTDPIHVPCLTSPYQNPPFTAPNLSIWPIPPPGGGNDWFSVESPELTCEALYPLPRLSTKKYDESVFQVYPVPAYNFIHVLNSNIGENVYIYNMIGKIVLKELIVSNDQVLRIHKLSNGIYYLKTDSGTNIVKIIKTDH